MTKAEHRTLKLDLLELLRDVAAEELHGVRLARELGGRFLDATLGCGAAEELKADATSTLTESADALRCAIAANVALARAAVAAKGKATDWLASIVEGWLAAQEDGKPPSPPPPKDRPPRENHDERRKRLSNILQVIGDLRRDHPSEPLAPVAPRPVDAMVKIGPSGGTTTIRLKHGGAGDARVSFQVGACTPVDRGAPFRVLVQLEPEELTLRPGVEESAELTVPWDARFEPGATYRVPITVAGLARQIIVHIVVEGGTS